jgi:hypothetical protein
MLPRQIVRPRIQYSPPLQSLVLRSRLPQLLVRNAHSPLPLREVPSTRNRRKSDLLQSLILRLRLFQPTTTSGGSASLQSSQVRPSATSGRESIVGSITSGEGGAPTCTDCEHGSFASAPRSKYGSGTPSSGSSGHAEYSTASSLGPYPSSSTLAHSSSAFAASPSATIFTSQEGAASQYRQLVWALALGIMLYFV